MTHLTQTFNNAAKTKVFKSKLWNCDSKLSQILKMFKWKAIPCYQGLYVKSWQVTNQQGDRAILFQDSSGFFMGAIDQDEYLEGVFKGYENKKVFKKVLLLKGINLDAK